ncbi:hypothetical protein VPHD69_0239 [Vibrio phage D69]
MNIIIHNSKWTESDLKTLFGDEPVGFWDGDELSHLAVELGAYVSTSQARKAGRVGPIPKGWTEWKPNKKMRAWLWNPTE